MEQHQVRQRRACDVLQVDRSTVRYLSRRGDDAELRDAIKRVSRDRRRFGCRRIHVMIAREGFTVNHKKVRRIYREEKLQVRRRGGRKRALGTRKPMVLPNGPNQRWSLNFVSDALIDGRRFPFWRLLTTSAARTWCWSRTHPCQDIVLCENWIAPLLSAVPRRQQSQTMELRSPAWRSSNGYRIRASIGTISCLESTSRRASPNASTASYVMNASMKRYSAHWARPAKSWKNGRRTRIGADHIPHWAI